MAKTSDKIVTWACVFDLCFTVHNLDLQLVTLEDDMLEMLAPVPQRVLNLRLHDIRAERSLRRYPIHTVP